MKDQVDALTKKRATAVYAGEGRCHRVYGPADRIP